MAQRKFNCRKSASSYKNGCRCEDCRLANRTYSREYARKVRRPDSSWLADRRVAPDEVVAHLRWLKQHGIGTVEVHRACGVDMNTLADLRMGRKKWLYAKTADRILAVGLHRSPTEIEVVRLKVDGLLAKGWTQVGIAEAAGISDYTVWEIANRKRDKVWRRTAERLLAIDATSESSIR